ncbi:ethanolamine ammonia-lyase subunit EutC [Duganella phyllosphaerae]|uniref:Ethanolamine ammonia-lyase small subunit n=1 Tax=Duganella phyllosphaerae TaxID=762836 RepID=A0A1E7WJT2_9BURK|nr:ethanolamine ammonia-lyase subunit EutC [Duganella phyllosphaerae]OEZ98888.1 ethanolamine ammonia-lyase light chain [Duganella phyllosphaerae]
MSELEPHDGADQVQEQGLVVDNPWAALRRFTAARIALGRTGVSQPTAPQLAFQLAHAQARDAVHQALDVAPLLAGLAKLCGQPALSLHSAAASRDIYLQRPDLGRRLDDASRETLQQQARADDGFDLAVVVADGLSALAIEQNVLPFLACLAARLAPESWTLAPPAVVLQGRVAVGDEVGQLLGARAVLVLVGERPGLSSPDSMGLYLTWAPRVGLTDASRNCISNVRPAGLGYEAAAFKLHYLLSEARRRQLSGVALKDETAGSDSALSASPRNFLLE